MMKNTFQSSKWRCGLWSVVILIVIIVCSVCFVILADILTDRYALQMDLSYSAVTRQSEITDSVLKSLERDVQIYLVSSGSSEYDIYMNESSNLEAILQRYRANCSHISFEKQSLVQNPLLATRFTDAVGENAVSPDCLIIHCNDTGRTRILDGQDYYVYSFDNETGYYISGYRYEKCITEAILYVSGDELPVLQFLTGHSEFSLDDLENMVDRFISANYAIKQVNLRKGEAPDPASPLFIISPQYDLTDSELKILDAFAEEGGDFFICCEFSDPIDLPNFNTLLRTYGIEAYPGMVVADASGSYYDNSPYYLMPYLQNNALTSSLINASENIYILAGARAFRYENSTDGMTEVKPVLVTDKAYITDYTADDLSRKANDVYGNLTVAAFSTRVTSSGERSKAFIAGNVTMFSEIFMQNNTSSIPMMLQMTQNLQSIKPVDLDILPKTAERESMILRSPILPIIIVSFLPLLVLILALSVLLPRRNR